MRTCVISSVKCGQCNVQIQVKVELLYGPKSRACGLRDDSYIFPTRTINVISPKNMAAAVLWSKVQMDRVQK